MEGRPLPLREVPPPRQSSLAFFLTDTPRLPVLNTRMRSVLWTLLTLLFPKHGEGQQILLYTREISIGSNAQHKSALHACLHSPTILPVGVHFYPLDLYLCGTVRGIHLLLEVVRIAIASFSSSALVEAVRHLSGCIRLVEDLCIVSKRRQTTRKNEHTSSA